MAKRTFSSTILSTSTKRIKKTNGFWNDRENILQFLNEIKLKYNLQTSEDWNKITSKHIQENGGSRLLQSYSMYNLKCFGCPEGKKNFTKREQYKPSKYWNNEENILQFLEEIKLKYNIKTPDDWNKITKKQIQENGGWKLFDKYSLYNLKSLACPEGKFNQKKTKGYWKDNKNILQFLEELKLKFDVKTPEDWNKITSKHIQENGGWELLRIYSMYDLKSLACPEGKLIFNKPKQHKPSKYWDNKENILQFLEELKVKFNLHTPEDWNLISKNQIKSFGGSRLFDKYSLYNLKSLACPEGKLIFNKPNQSKPSNFWENENNRNYFIEKLKLTFNLQTPDDWKRLSTHQIRSQGGGWLFNTSKNYLEKIYIKFNSNDDRNVQFSLKELIESNYKRSSQKWLFFQVQKLFPNEEIVEDYFHSDISRDSGFSVQFDVFLIRRNIAIEYHGVQHYEDIPSAGFASLELHHSRDLEKKNLCKKYGIQLIIIPYWWDNNIESLRETLNSII